MRERRQARPQKIELTDHEMLVGDYSQPCIEPSGAWNAAVQARGHVLTGFHLLRAVRPDMDEHPVEVASKREDAVELAGRITEVAVAYEMTELMAEITAKLRTES